MSHRILLIEDEPSLLLSLSDRLESEGYAVKTAADGEAGLEQAASGRFDLVLLDVMLPKKSGFDVCRDLRQRAVGTPILMLTARGEVVDRVVGLKLGADDYLTKPLQGWAVVSPAVAATEKEGGDQGERQVGRNPHPPGYQPLRRRSSVMWAMW